jgi:hypothetical protein
MSLDIFLILEYNFEVLSEVAPVGVNPEFPVWEMFANVPPSFGRREDLSIPNYK